MRFMRPVFTPEQAGLFARFCEEMPGVARVDWESVAIDEVNGKRVLCLLYFVEGMEAGAYLHFHPVGLTEEEQDELTRRHGLDSIDTLDGHKRRLP